MRGRSDGGFKQSLITMVMVGSGLGVAFANQSPGKEADRDAYFRNCDEARAAGVAPIYAGRNGYREELDGDSDGIACEPYRR